MRLCGLFLMCLVLSGCLGMPESVVPVKDFEVDRYLGKWYEIARLDHSFERGLKQISADYALREDGGISVVNRGYLIEEQAWKEAEGKAYFVDDKTAGYLKVSFFGPFYGSYVIFGLGQDSNQEPYQYSFVSGPDHSYLWLLSRTPEVDQQVIDAFKSEAVRLGFNVEQLIFVDHN